MRVRTEAGRGGLIHPRYNEDESEACELAVVILVPQLKILRCSVSDQVLIEVLWA
ncbi:hypothetical protein SAMN05421640_1476 [Ekhidna lutea]|uniref:Uncharacterized protein n=1 Tax=Ekhidna lutea TaxID=447679 RepID=A0A239HSQ4_EKHLU|nr:hypothetical protein SAMN05421640_1476 [Ekhidna lutea]